MRGIYLLHLRVFEDAMIRVGSLGKILFKRGDYAYVGSAQRALEKRIMRHALRRKPLRWHIDYLTTSPKVSTLEAIGYDLPRRYECIVAKYLEKEGFKPIKGFGSTDCSCTSHLYMIDKRFSLLIERLSSYLGVKPLKLDLR